MYDIPKPLDIKDIHNKKIDNNRNELSRIKESINSLQELQKISKKIKETCDNISNNFSTESDPVEKKDDLLELWCKFDNATKTTKSIKKILF